ncbi:MULTISPECIES: cupin domain-containing protein [unclassified Variovorax]|uniref:cupin domain-containing protein n=1 Tax=unclassified Variovorax TaxID=663243 RepID=UPI0008399E7C|nr:MULTISPECIES: cupin domain-containing protein [unclassified Variovorax]PNG53174.1 hypothetical protein CHC06_04519 [Variovorax sp. B2]PNG53746.1 hypothetical protein CHC07_03566 [Variovorax sp. B4]VTV11197.1 Cupin domain protein [Variovorax sp. WDL1]
MIAALIGGAGPGAAAAVLKDADLAKAGVGVAHFFGGGAYVKETEIPAGAALAQHAHDHDHLSYLVSGEVRLEVEGHASPMWLRGPCAIEVKAGRTHAVHAVTDAVWLCIWATDCTDPERVDEVLLG